MVVLQPVPSPRGLPKAALPSRRLNSILAIALLLLTSLVPLFAVADLPGDTSGTVAVVFSPGSDKAVVLAAVARADGLVVREGGWGAVMVVHSDKSGFARRLRQAGAWFVVDPRSAAGCLIVGT